MPQFSFIARTQEGKRKEGFIEASNINRASEKLKTLEKSSRIQNNKSSKKESDKIQLSFFDLQDPVLKKIRDEIQEVNIDELTPVEALIKLNEIKRALKNSTNK